jgi:hypothetical protein
MQSWDERPDVSSCTLSPTYLYAASVSTILGHQRRERLTRSDCYSSVTLGGTEVNVQACGAPNAPADWMYSRSSATLMLALLLLLLLLLLLRLPLLPLLLLPLPLLLLLPLPGALAPPLRRRPTMGSAFIQGASQHIISYR